MRNGQLVYMPAQHSEGAGMQTYFMFGTHSEKDIDPHEPSGPKIRFAL